MKKKTRTLRNYRKRMTSGKVKGNKNSEQETVMQMQARKDTGEGGSSSGTPVASPQKTQGYYLVEARTREHDKCGYTTEKIQKTRKLAKKENGRGGSAGHGLRAVPALDRVG